MWVSVEWDDDCVYDRVGVVSSVVVVVVMVVMVMMSDFMIFLDGFVVIWCICGRLLD